jgi:hypothetical protein
MCGLAIATVFPRRWKSLMSSAPVICPAMRVKAGRNTALRTLFLAETPPTGGRIPA